MVSLFIALIAQVPEPANISEMIQLFQNYYETAGVLGAVAALLFIVIRIVRMDFLQALLPMRLKWINWPDWLKLVFPILLSGVAAGLYVFGGGGLWQAAVAAAISAALSIFGHHTTKALGAYEASWKLKEDINYKPSKAREAFSIVVPIPVEKVKKDMGIL